MAQRKPVKRNPIAKSLESPLFRKRVIPSGVNYKRRERSNKSLRRTHTDEG